jgi:hypothetical protein
VGGRGHSCGAAGALVKLLILSGARRNEITAPPRDQIKAEVIELPSERTKNGLPHTIPITPPRARLVTYGPNLLGTFSAGRCQRADRRPQSREALSR